MLGAPLYMNWASAVAASIIQKYQDEIIENKLNVPITKEDFLFAGRKDDRSGEVTMPLDNYMIMQLLRLGKTNVKQVTRITKFFYNFLDVKGTHLLRYKDFKLNEDGEAVILDNDTVEIELSEL